MANPPRVLIGSVECKVFKILARRAVVTVTVTAARLIRPTVYTSIKV